MFDDDDVKKFTYLYHFAILERHKKMWPLKLSLNKRRKNVAKMSHVIFASSGKIA
jgi:hypothetical protein